MQTVGASPSYLTARDVQELIRVDRSTIYRMAESGRLPAIKVGRQWRFPADAIEEFLGGPSNGTQGGRTPSHAQDVADLFADLYGVMVIVTDITGNPITEISNPCGYFAAVSSEAAALDRCIAEWNALGGQYDFEPRLRPSHLGFLCTRAFIRIGNELSGMVISGGIAPAAWPPAPERIEAIALESRVPLPIIEQSIEDVHRIDPEEQERFLAAIPVLARHLSNIATEERRTSDQTRSAT
ncbi:MAG: PocR ligand-binding domain-containing protein [Acidimicrobiia bacterium]